MCRFVSANALGIIVILVLMLPIFSRLAESVIGLS